MQLSPVFNIPAFTDSDGNPLAGGKIFAYEAGSFSTLKDTFSTQAGDVANANPIVLDSAGCLPAGVNIWLTPNEAYNLILTEADGTTVIKSFDNVTGIPAGSSGGGGTLDGVWVIVEGGTFLSPTSFLVTGNQVANFVVGNRARLQLSTGYVYGTVTGSSFSTNTTVTVQLDGGATLNASLDEAAYSLLIQNGRTIDAGAVSYLSTGYSTAGTVGKKLDDLDTDIVDTNTRIDALRKVWPSSGTGTYTITPSPSATSYSQDMVFTVKFGNATAGAATLNISGLGTKSLKVLDSSGAKVDPNITASMVSDVAYDGTDFILLDALPASAAVATPRGIEVFTSNGTFEVPASVYYIKVTCVGAGGGGGSGFYTVGEGGETVWTGGGGGGGSASVKYISTSPGTTYSVAVGLGGAGGAGSYFSTSPGDPGGQSSFGVTLVTAPGGSGGNGASSTSNGTNGAGGLAGTGDFRVRGSRGEGVGTPGDAALGYGFGAATNGGAGQSYGGGGHGATGDGATSGGAGANGLVTVEW